MKLSIIIVNYNTYTLTKQTIDSVLEKKLPFKYEIMLVDNASQDDSMARLQEDYKEIISQGLLNITLNDANLGFAKANNIGMRRSKGEYILLLNSDTYVVEDCLEKCLAYIEQYNTTGLIDNSTLTDKLEGREHAVSRVKDEKVPMQYGREVKNYKIGALGCRVILPDGTLDHACKRGFPTPRASFYYFLKLHKRDKVKYGLYDALHLDENEVGEVDCLMGAFMLIPRHVLDQVGLLDEDFFMYGEDIDLCYRIKEGGYKIMYYPEASIIHYKGGSSKKRRTKVIYDFHNAMWIFYKKHYIKTYSLWINTLVYTGIWAKYALEIGKNAMKPNSTVSRKQSKPIQQNKSM